MDHWYAASPGKITDCRPPYSFFFELIKPLMAGAAGDAQANSNPLHRICSLMRKMKVGFLIEESLRDHPLLSEEAIAVSARTGLQIGQKATRITFFRNAKTVETYPHFAAENCLGYVIIFELTPEKKQPIRYVYEAVITVPCLSLKDGTYLPLSNYYTSGFRKYTFTLGTADNHAPLSIEGTYFCQQNDRTHVCAHAALRMAVNNSWVRPSSLLTPEEINRALKIDHVTKTVGKLEGEAVSKGVTLNEISTVIESLGAKAQTAVFSDNPSVDYQEFVYPIVESGCPVILGINRPDMAHVVTILGHTLNSDRWMPQAQAANGYGGYPIAKYISSTAWVDHFIISDDNFGMFVTLHTEGIRNIIVPKYNSNLHASVAVGIVPPDVLSVGSTAEQLAALFAGRFLEGLPVTVGNRWLLQLKSDAKVGALVCRTLLATRADYVAHWRSLSDQHNAQVAGDTVDELEKQLPARFWVTELSVPNLYAGNKRKLGDVITACDVDASKEQLNAVKAIILPEFALLFGGGKLSPLKGPWAVGGHVPLLRGHWSKESPTEW